WMALFCENMLEIAVELALTDSDYVDMALKFSEHFMWIASSMTHLGGETSMWDEDDGFFYDVLALAERREPTLESALGSGLTASLRGHLFRWCTADEDSSTRRTLPLVPGIPPGTAQRYS